MSTNSGNNPIEEIKPTSRVEPPIDRDQGKKNLVFAISDHKKTQTELPLQVQAHSLPSKIVQFFSESKTMLGLLELLGITSKSCSLIGGDGNSAIPYLGLFSSPTYLYHSASKAYERFKIMTDAILVKRVSDAFFWAAKGLDSTGTSIGIVTKTSSSVLTLLGFSTFAVFGLMFTLIMPILLTVLGALGGIAIGCSLWKNARAIKHYESLKELSDTLEYLQGPKLRLEKEDSDTDKAAKERLHRLETNNFESVHFSSDPRSLYIKQKLDKIQTTIASQKEFAIKMKEELRDVFLSMKDMEEIFQRILTMKEGDEFKLIEDMHYLYDKLAANHNLNEELRFMMNENRKELRRTLALARKTSFEAGSDMHRVLCYNALFLLMSVIMVADGILILVAPQHAAISSCICIGVSILDLGFIIFDKNVEIEQFHRLKQMITQT